MSITCPHCNSQTLIPVNAINNAINYREPNLVSLPCCNRAIVIKPIIQWEYDRYEGTKVTDDWGNDIEPYGYKGYVVVRYESRNVVVKDPHNFYAYIPKGNWETLKDYVDGL